MKMNLECVETANMINLKHLDAIIDEKDRFGVKLKEITSEKPEHIQLKIALSLLEYLHNDKYIGEKDIEKIGKAFFVSKERYFIPKTPQKSKVFAIRINLSDSKEEIDKKITELKHKITKYRNSEGSE